MLTRLLPALFLITPALAQAPAPANLVRALCQPDGCDEFLITENVPVRATPEGELRRIRVKTYHSSRAGRTEGSEQNGYVYCSQTRPAVLASNGGRTRAFMLAPFSAERRDQVRLQNNFIGMYFGACHGPEFARRAIQDLRGTATLLSYRVPAAASSTVDLARVEDILPKVPATAPVAKAPEPIPGPVAHARPREDDILPPDLIPED